MISLQCRQIVQKINRKKEFRLTDRVQFSFEILEQHYVNNETIIEVGGSIENLHHATALILLRPLKLNDCASIHHQAIRKFMIINFLKIRLIEPTMAFGYQLQFTNNYNLIFPVHTAIGRGKISDQETICWLVYSIFVCLFRFIYFIV